MYNQGQPISFNVFNEWVTNLITLNKSMSRAFDLLDKHLNRELSFRDSNDTSKYADTLAHLTDAIIESIKTKLPRAAEPDDHSKPYFADTTTHLGYLPFNSVLTIHQGPYHQHHQGKESDKRQLIDFSVKVQSVDTTFYHYLTKPQAKALLVSAKEVLALSKSIELLSGSMNSLRVKFIKDCDAIIEILEKIHSHQPGQDTSFLDDIRYISRSVSLITSSIMKTLGFLFHLNIRTITVYQNVIKSSIKNLK